MDVFNILPIVGLLALAVVMVFGPSSRHRVRRLAVGVAIALFAKALSTHLWGDRTTLVIGLVALTVAVFGLFRRIHKPVPGVAIALLTWILSMHLWGGHIHRGPFFSYPLWFVWLAVGVVLFVLLLGYVLPGGQQRRRRLALSANGGLVLALAFVMGVMWVSPASASSKTPPKTTTPTVTTPATTTTTKPPAKNHRMSAADFHKNACATLKLTGGIQCSQIRTGKNVNFNQDPNVRGTAAFVPVTLKSRADVAKFLNGNSVQSVAARQRVTQALSKMPGERARALNGSGYYAVQFNVSVQYFGIGYFTDGRVIDETGARQVGPNDILWLFVNSKGVIVPGASIRADCGNPHFTLIVPVTSMTPPAPSIATPPTFCAVTGKPPVQGVCGKQDSQSPLYNPKVPSIVKGCGKDGLPSGNCEHQGGTPPKKLSTFTNVGTDGYQKGHDPNTTAVTTTTKPACEYRTPSGTCTSRPVTTAPPVNVGGGTPTTSAPPPSSG